MGIAIAGIFSVIASVGLIGLLIAALESVGLIK